MLTFIYSIYVTKSCFILVKTVQKVKKKKFQKTFEKGIDKAEALWYNTEAVAEKGSEWSLKIEQQEISTKQM